MPEIRPTTRRGIVWTLRIVIPAIVLIGVSHTIQSAWDKLSEQDWQLRPAWLIVSGALYLAGLGAMAAFWHYTLTALGQSVPWLTTLRAYYLGHLGKYVPGKALVVVIRVATITRLRLTCPCTSTWPI